MMWNWSTCNIVRPFIHVSSGVVSIDVKIIGGWVVVNSFSFRLFKCCFGGSLFLYDIIIHFIFFFNMGIFFLLLSNFVFSVKLILRFTFVLLVLFFGFNLSIGQFICH